MKKYITANAILVKLQANDLIMSSADDGVSVSDENATDLTLNWGEIGNAP